MNFQKQTLAAGLYFVGVPIGSARDITLRALDVLASVDCLAAEDTRSLRRLMDIHGVPLDGRPVISLHDHSKPETVSRLVERMRAGQSLAYASEAGMPLIADPGFELARAAQEAEVPVTCAPGPSAAMTALVLAGLPTDAFFFAGFLPSARAARRSRLEALKEVDATLVFYESPKRVAEMLADAEAALGGERRCAVCRELTKKFEEVQRGSVGELAEFYKQTTVKGEIVVLIGKRSSQKISETDIRSELEIALASHSMRDAVDLVARARNVPRRGVYQLALEMTKEQ